MTPGPDPEDLRPVRGCLLALLWGVLLWLAVVAALWLALVGVLWASTPAH